ncbi:MAG: class I SAM-dependent methyltransferase, partial [Ignavibacteriae bacterium]|nr:class I SAM-dependent methyltransferase [Ignavibacteriota bacterium]
GCGCGEFLYFLQAQDYVNLWGVDVSPQQVEGARQLGLTSVTLELGDCLAFLRRHPESFALINAQNLLEHFTKDELFELLDAVTEALRPGGTLLAVVPNAGSIFGLRTRYYDITHELAFTPMSLMQVLTAVGLTQVQFLEHGPVVLGVKSAVRFCLWQAIRQCLKFYLLVELAGDRHYIFTQDIGVDRRARISHPRRPSYPS